ncbi:hypothetical protein EVAR_102093_1 [Eumeta japonica]|uniref:Uncharacterized protein n=1 Tax=Eumeta variegata TaxID=151549 RepID=A0A4C1TZQ1_EUMVA|nr:hypothetical protein EVAR_102093_1 [Eumeta japonica]
MHRHATPYPDERVISEDRDAASRVRFEMPIVTQLSRGEPHARGASIRIEMHEGGERRRRGGSNCFGGININGRRSAAPALRPSRERPKRRVIGLPEIIHEIESLAHPAH